MSRSSPVLIWALSASLVLAVLPSPAQAAAISAEAVAQAEGVLPAPDAARARLTAAARA